MKKLLIATLLGLTAASAQVQAKTLLVYYSLELSPKKVPSNPGII